VISTESSKAQTDLLSWLGLVVPHAGRSASLVDFELVVLTVDHMTVTCTFPKFPSMASTVQTSSLTPDSPRTRREARPEGRSMEVAQSQALEAQRLIDRNIGYQKNTCPHWLYEEPVLPPVLVWRSKRARGSFQTTSCTHPPIYQS